MQRPATSHPSAHEKTGRHDTVDRVGKYDLIAVLAHGGMGDVYLAVLQGPLGFSKLLVIKELRPDVQDDDAHVAMFLDEARLAARLNHPNIVQTIEVGADGRRRFIAMEYLEGQPLNRVLHRARKRGNPLPLPMHFRIVADALTALEYAHTFTEFDGRPLGIVHRDVSPQNVFVTYEGHVKLIDFGVARTAVASQQTRPGSLKGKLKYMSPEQAAGRFVDARTDIFATGVMLWEGTVGAGPWEGLADLDILKNLMAGRVPRLGNVRPDLDPDLRDIVDRAMSPDPNDRYPSAVAMRDEVEHYVSSHGLSLGRELPAFVSILFREDRRKLRDVIEAQLRTLAEISPVESLSISGLRRMSTGSVEGRPARRIVSATDSIDGGPGSMAAAAAPATSTVSPASPRIPSGFWTVGAAMASAAAFGTLAVHLSLRMPMGKAAPSATWTRPASPAALPAPFAAPPALAPQVPRRLAHISLRATPAWANLLVDGFPVSNPYVADWAADGAIHHLSASAQGYVDQTSVVMLDKDVVVDLALEHVPPPRKAAAAISPPPRPTASPAPTAPPISSEPMSLDAVRPAPPLHEPVDRLWAPKRDLDTNNPYP